MHSYGGSTANSVVAKLGLSCRASGSGFKGVLGFEGLGFKGLDLGLRRL